MTPYPEDEFDHAARSRGPKGVHRPTEPQWKRYAVLVIALILGPLLAWGFVSALNRNPSDGGATPTPTPTASVPATEDPSGLPTTSPAVEESTAPVTPEPTPEPTVEPTTQAPEANFQAPVSILNGTRVQGLAGRVTERVTALGFTDATAGNHSGTEPTLSTVFYNSPELAYTASVIAEELGITALVEQATFTDSITVVLRADFNE